MKELNIAVTHRLVAWILVALCASGIEYFGMMRTGELILTEWYDWGFFIFGMISSPAIAWRAFMDQSVTIYKNGGDNRI